MTFFSSSWVFSLMTESNSARLIGMGGVPLLLTHHSDWHQADSKNRYISLRKAILNTLKNITNLSECTPQHLCTQVQCLQSGWHKRALDRGVLLYTPTLCIATLTHTFSLHACEFFYAVVTLLHTSFLGRHADVCSCCMLISTHIFCVSHIDNAGAQQFFLSFFSPFFFQSLQHSQICVH